jgi:hypothetical protein
MYQDPFSAATGLAILGAALASIVIGFIWYHPRVFGGMWMRLSGITPEMVEKAKRRKLLHAFFGLFASILVAYVMFWFGAAWSVYDWPGALQLAFWCWIGFVAPALLGTVIWEQRPFRLFLINASYWLAALIVMALVLLL